MADTNPTPLNIEALNALGGRLFDHNQALAASIEFEPIVRDLKFAARALFRFASVHFRVAEIAALAPQQNGSATARDLRDALDNAARMS